MELGIFHFLLQLTMDASIETFENKSRYLRYIVEASVYCVALIFARVYLAPANNRNTSSVVDEQELEDITRGEGDSIDVNRDSQPLVGRSQNDGGGSDTSDFGSVDEEWSRRLDLDLDLSSLPGSGFDELGYRFTQEGIDDYAPGNSLL